MKKTFAALITMFMLGMLMFAPAASATGGDDNVPSPDNNKKVTLCHATSSETNPYEKITVSVNAFYNAGHISHEGDIYEGFSWTDNKGNVTVVPPRGDLSLLAFDDCVKPVVKTPVAKPEAVYADPCGTKDDVFSVAPGTGYTVGPVVVDGNKQSITVTLADGFKWATGGPDSFTITKPVFDTEPCDLPETGGVVTNTLGGLAVLALLGAGGVFLYRRRNLTV